jgi:hypothetical protein
MRRFVFALSLTAVLALPGMAPASVHAGGGGNGCPINYGLTTYSSDGADYWANYYAPNQGYNFPTLQNSPLRKAASKADKNDNDLACQKFGGPGPQFVDDTFVPYNPN